jgi:hypothetical protein
MMWLTQTKPSIAIRSIIEQIIANNQMNRSEYVQLTSAILSGQKITEEERCQISRVFDYIQIGRLRLVD